MRTSALLAALLVAIGLSSSTYGCELLNRMLHRTSCCSECKPCCATNCDSCVSECESCNCSSGCQTCSSCGSLGALLGGNRQAMYNACNKNPRISYSCFKICFPKPVLPMPKIIKSTECLDGECGCMNNGANCSYNLPPGVGQDLYGGYGYLQPVDPRFNVPVRQQYTDMLPPPIVPTN